MRKLLLLLLVIAALIVTIISTRTVKPEDIANESSGMGWAGVDVGEKISAEDARRIYPLTGTMFGLSCDEYEFYKADVTGFFARDPQGQYEVYVLPNAGIKSLEQLIERAESEVDPDFLSYTNVIMMPYDKTDFGDSLMVNLDDIRKAFGDGTETSREIRIRENALMFSKDYVTHAKGTLTESVIVSAIGAYRQNGTLIYGRAILGMPVDQVYQFRRELSISY